MDIEVYKVSGPAGTGKNGLNRAMAGKPTVRQLNLGAKTSLNIPYSEFSTEQKD